MAQQLYAKLPPPSSGPLSPMSAIGSHAYYARKRTKARGGVFTSFHSPHPSLGVTLTIKALKIA